MPPPKKHASTRRRRNKVSTATTLTIPTTTDFSDWTIAELKDKLKELGLSRAGNKPHMIARLVDAEHDIPELPERPEGWHPKTQELWRDIWLSPMSPEWVDADIHNVYALAISYDDIWTADTPSGRRFASQEFRALRVDLGLSPLARRKLEWTIEGAKSAKDQGEKRRRKAEPPPEQKPADEEGGDPRLSLAS